MDWPGSARRSTARAQPSRFYSGSRAPTCHSSRARTGAHHEPSTCTTGTGSVNGRRRSGERASKRGMGEPPVATPVGDGGLTVRPAIPGGGCGRWVAWRRLEPVHSGDGGTVDGPRVTLRISVETNSTKRRGTGKLAALGLRSPHGQRETARGADEWLPGEGSTAEISVPTPSDLQDSQAGIASACVTHTTTRSSLQTGLGRCFGQQELVTLRLTGLSRMHCRQHGGRAVCMASTPVDWSPPRSGRPQQASRRPWGSGGAGLLPRMVT